MFKGFDTDTYPGDQIMQELKPYFDFVAFYLRAPSHHDQSWVQKLTFLGGLGYGTVPVFGAQETVGPGSHIITPTQGALDGQEWADSMTSAGFAPNSRAFQDLENGPPFSQTEQDYLGSSLTKFKNLGFSPGVYSSHSFANTVLMDNPGAAIWAFKVPTTNKTSASLPLPPAPAPAESGIADALVFQYRQNVVLTLPSGGTLLIDCNSSTVPDPSAI